MNILKRFTLVVLRNKYCPVPKLLSTVNNILFNKIKILTLLFNKSLSLTFIFFLLVLKHIEIEILTIILEWNEEY